VALEGTDQLLPSVCIGQPGGRELWARLGLAGSQSRLNACVGPLLPVIEGQRDDALQSRSWQQ
jgi:hypothetical protein